MSQILASYSFSMESSVKTFSSTENPTHTTDGNILASKYNITTMKIYSMTFSKGASTNIVSLFNVWNCMRYESIRIIFNPIRFINCINLFRNCFH